MPLTTILNETTTIGLSRNDDEDYRRREEARQEMMFLLPFCILSLFVTISYLLYTFIKRRRLDQLRHQLVPLYNFEPGEGDDWETEVLDPHLDEKLPKKYDYHTIDMRKNT